MNIKEFISSGVLESYVLGLANEKEVAEVELMRTQFPEIKDELEAIEKSLERYAYAHSKNPPAELKNIIWNKIQEEVESEMSDNQVVMHVERGEGFWDKYLRIAASFLLLGSILGNIYLYNRLKATQEELISERTNNNLLVQEVKLSTESLKRVEEVLSNPDYKGVKMMGKNGFALICWNQKTNFICLFKPNLPTAPIDKEYQLWAQIDGKMVSVGMVKMDKTEQFFNKMANVTAFAISIEPKGGSPQPTGEVYCYGKILS